MRLVGRVLTLSGLALVAAACDTNQPTGIEGGAAVLEYRVESVADPTPGVQNVFEAVVYPDLLVDSNGDGVPDGVVPALNEFNAPPVCETGGTNAVPTTALVPWPIALEVSVVRAGTTVPLVLDSTQTATGNFEFSRVSDYDTSGTPIPDRTIVDEDGEPDPRPISGGLTALAWTNGVSTHTASAVFLTNCTAQTQIPPYTNTAVQLGRGDLLRVMVRRGANGPTGRPARFTAQLLVNGAPVEVRGDQTVDESRSDVTFTYLVN